jgi:hypothetical protein
MRKGISIVSVSLLLVCSSLQGMAQDIPELNPQTASVMPSEALNVGATNFAETNSTAGKPTVYKDFSFSSGNLAALDISQTIFNDEAICGHYQKAVFDLIKVDPSKGDELISRTPMVDSEFSIPLNQNQAYRLRVWIYDYTCPGPSFWFVVNRNY